MSMSGVDCDPNTSTSRVWQPGPSPQLHGCVLALALTTVPGHAPLLLAAMTSLLVLGLARHGRGVCPCRGVTDPGPPTWACSTPLVGPGGCARDEVALGSPHPTPAQHPALQLPGGQHLLVIRGWELFQLKTCLFFPTTVAGLANNISPLGRSCPV